MCICRSEATSLHSTSFSLHTQNYMHVHLLHCYLGQTELECVQRHIEGRRHRERSEH